MDRKCLAWCLAHGRYSGNIVIATAIIYVRFSWKGLCLLHFMSNAQHVVTPVPSPCMTAELNENLHVDDGG